MIKKITRNFIQDESNEAVADCFNTTFENQNFEYIETSELMAIDNALDALKAAKILQKWAISELSNYHKALRAEIKERQEDYF